LTHGVHLEYLLVNLQKSYIARRCCWLENDDPIRSFTSYRRLLNNLTENLYMKGTQSDPQSKHTCVAGEPIKSKSLLISQLYTDLVVLSFL